jgi:phenylpropionate dioxygenase-like ring-hydroxylating dioxygenase large terminal subunit
MAEDSVARRPGSGELKVNWPARFNEVPKEVFHREDVYHLELERIFRGPHWHPVAHRSEVPQPGDFKTAYIGDAPVLVVHGDDGRIRVFENACAHRGTMLATSGRGHAQRLQCPYHRWVFSLNGELLGAPGMDGFSPGFRKEDHGLRELRSSDVYGLVFATYSAAVPDLETYLEESAPYIGRILGGDGRLKLLGYQKVTFDCNWKLYNDNEGYHGPLLHAAFRILQLQAGSGTQFMTSRGHKVNATELPPVKNASFLSDPSVIEARDPKLAPSNVIVSLFPLAQFTHNLDVINIRHAYLHSPSETEVHYAYFAHQDDGEELVRHRVQQASNLIGPSGFISLEDGAVFSRIQRASPTTRQVAFQRGVTGRIEGYCTLDRGDEAGNLVRWERYREAMGFEREA